MRAAALLVLALGACDWSLHRMQEPVGCRTHAPTALLAGGGCDLEPPVGVVAIDPPATEPPLTRALVERGRDRFERICAPCHGLTGDGDSAVARVMTVRRPPTLVDATAAGFSDARIDAVIARGYGLMPSYAPILSLPDRVAVRHYLRVLQSREVRAEETAWRP